MPSVAMLLPLGWVVFTALLGCATALTTSDGPLSPDPRLLFKFITITPEQCNSISGNTGICYSKQDCATRSGTGDGNCAKGLGVCCTFTRTCGESTKYGDTTFTNPSYPNAETAGTGNCELTVIPMNDNICQVRLDLVEFTLAQPNPDGECKDDFMVVTGGSSTVPQICGDNAGQHMYVDMVPNSSGNIKINIDSSTASSKWNIRVRQIACTSTNRAPNGCLQYFTETSGVVSSFNYASTTTEPTATRQLADQAYGVCIQSHSGYCSVTWMQPDDEGEYYFTVTEDASSVPPGTPGTSLVGDACVTDYVVIPSGEFTADVTTAVVTTADRFCGLGFPSEVESNVSPHVLYVITNSVDVTMDLDFANQGFSLKYRANACS